ncbi:16S rRNA (cytosine(1402)-N(4))-methyltransferase, partial [uncultured Sneathia sp.]
YICFERQKGEIKTTTQLADIVIRAVGKKMKKHPAKRTFQALRVFVNSELDVLKKTIDDAIELLNPGGRLLIITFQSLEDKIVKERFRYYENPCICPKDIPICVCGKKPMGKIINKKAICASEKELKENNRAHSAQLRIFERI